MAWLPRGVEPVSDVARARWVVEGVDPWDLSGPLRVSNFLPRRFEAYARIGHPSRDNLPEELLSTLLPALEKATSRPDKCWFCLWDGYGAWWSRSHTPHYAPGANADEIDEYWLRAREQDAILRNTPRVVMDGRSYFLFRGPMVASSMNIGTSEFPLVHSPNIWWPDDRAWCVSSEIDAYSTNVGGSRALIEELLAAPGLDTVEITPDQGMGPPYE